jgi:serine/threonine protein kinase
MSYSSREVVADRYEIVRQIGGGGMGTVYLALDLRLDKAECALKVLSDSDLIDPADKDSVRAAFKREASLLARLSHPNIPRVIDYFQSSEDSCIVMEYIRGKTLYNLVADRKNGRPLPENRVLELATQMCAVLQYLHDQVPPIIFRDVNPKNLMLDEHGVIKLIDFGIARIFKARKKHDTEQWGTPGFAAPEQYGDNQSDRRTDVYGLGVTLWFLLTGNMPVESDFGPFSAHLVNSRISDNTEKVIWTATQREPKNRFQNVWQMQDALQGKHRTHRTTQRAAREYVRSIVLTVDKQVKSMSAPPSNSWKQWLNNHRYGTIAFGISLLILGGAFLLASFSSALPPLSATATASTTSLPVTRASTLRTVTAVAETPTVTSTRPPTSTPVPERITADNIGKLTLWKLKTDAFGFAWMPDSVRPTVLVAGSKGLVFYDIIRDTSTLLSAEFGGSQVVAVNKAGTLGAVQGDADDIGVIEVKSQGIRHLLGHSNRIDALTFRSNTSLLSGGRDGRLLLWDLSTYSVTAAFASDENNPVNVIAMSSQGNIFASGSDDGLVRVWDPEAPDKPLNVFSHEQPVKGLAFSPDGKWLVSVGGQNGIRSWSLNNEDTFTLLGHVGETLWATFNHDGTLLATSGSDGTVRIWDWQNRTQLRVLNEVASPAIAVAFSIDDKYLLSLTTDNSIQIWRIY